MERTKPERYFIISLTDINIMIRGAAQAALEMQYIPDGGFPDDILDLLIHEERILTETTKPEGHRDA